MPYDTFIINTDVFSSMNEPMFVIYNPPGSQKLVGVALMELLNNHWVATNGGALVAYRITSPVVGENPSFTLHPLNTANKVPSGVSVTHGLDSGTGAGARFRAQYQSNQSISISSLNPPGILGHRFGASARRKYGGPNTNNGEVFIFANSSVKPIRVRENEAFVIGNPANDTTTANPTWYSVDGILKVESNNFVFSGDVAATQATQATQPFFAVVNATGSGVVVELVELSFRIMGDSAFWAYWMSVPWVRIQRAGLPSGGKKIAVTPLNSGNTPSAECYVSSQSAAPIQVAPIQAIFEEFLSPHGVSWQGWQGPPVNSALPVNHSPSIRPGLLRHLLALPQTGYNTPASPACLYFQQGARFSETFSAKDLELFPGESIAVVPDYSSGISGLRVRATIFEKPLMAQNQTGTYAYVG